MQSGLVFGDCHKIVGPPQNWIAQVGVLALGASNTKFIESIHKYIVQILDILLEITMAAMTTWFIKRPYDAQNGTE